MLIFQANYISLTFSLFWNFLPLAQCVYFGVHVFWGKDGTAFPKAYAAISGLYYKLYDDVFTRS